MSAADESVGDDHAVICDAHFHIFGPYSAFPLPADARYRPPEASPATYRAMAAPLGIGLMVLVQGGCYGTDNGAMLAAADTLGRENARSVAVIDDSFTPRDLQRLHDAGVRG